MIPDLFWEELRMRSLRSLEGLNRSLVIENFLRQMLVVEPDEAVQGLLQIVSTVEAMIRTQHLLQTTVETLDHAIGLRRLWPGAAR